MTRPRIVVATRSVHKLRELRELLELPGVELVALDDVGVDGEPEEDGATFRSNALRKARYYATRAGLPTLADDSGLEVDALGGGPGVRTRRYAGEDASDAENNAKLLADLAGVPPERRGARYRCVLVYVDPRRGRAPGPLVRTGTLRGRIASEPSGSGGFGYDPIFEPLGEPVGGRTVARLSSTQKGRISHRGRAARRMASALREAGLAGQDPGAGSTETVRGGTVGRPRRPSRG